MNRTIIKKMGRALLLTMANMMLLFLLILGGTIITLQTRWGKQQILNEIISSLQPTLAGNLTIKSLSGFLLGHASLHEVTIRDNQQNTVLWIEKINFHYDLLPLIKRHFHVSQMQIQGYLFIDYQSYSQDLALLHVFTAEKRLSSWRISVDNLKAQFKTIYRGFSSSKSPRLTGDIFLQTQLFFHHQSFKLTHFFTEISTTGELISKTQLHANFSWPISLDSQKIEISTNLSSLEQLKPLLKSTTLNSLKDVKGPLQIHLSSIFSPLLTSTVKLKIATLGGEIDAEMKANLSSQHIPWSAEVKIKNLDLANIITELPFKKTSAWLKIEGDALENCKIYPFAIIASGEKNSLALWTQGHILSLKNFSLNQITGTAFLDLKFQALQSLNKLVVLHSKLSKKPGPSFKQFIPHSPKGLLNAQLKLRLEPSQLPKLFFVATGSHLQWQQVYLKKLSLYANLYGLTGKVFLTMNQLIWKFDQYSFAAKLKGTLQKLSLQFFASLTRNHKKSPQFEMLADLSAASLQKNRLSHQFGLLFNKLIIRRDSQRFQLQKKTWVMGNFDPLQFGIKNLELVNKGQHLAIQGSFSPSSIHASIKTQSVSLKTITSFMGLSNPIPSVLIDGQLSFTTKFFKNLAFDFHLQNVFHIKKLKPISIELQGQYIHHHLHFKLSPKYGSIPVPSIEGEGKIVLENLWGHSQSWQKLPINFSLKIPEYSLSSSQQTFFGTLLGQGHISGVIGDPKLLLILEIEKLLCFNLPLGKFIGNISYTHRSPIRASMVIQQPEGLFQGTFQFPRITKINGFPLSFQMSAVNFLLQFSLPSNDQNGVGYFMNGHALIEGIRPHREFSGALSFRKVFMNQENKIIKSDSNPITLQF